MSKRWTKLTTFNVSFPLRKYHFTIKYFTSDVSEVYVITLVQIPKVLNLDEHMDDIDDIIC